MAERYSTCIGKNSTLVALRLRQCAKLARVSLAQDIGMCVREPRIGMKPVGYSCGYKLKYFLAIIVPGDSLY